MQRPSWSLQLATDFATFGRGKHPVCGTLLRRVRGDKPADLRSWQTVRSRPPWLRGHYLATDGLMHRSTGSARGVNLLVQLGASGHPCLRRHWALRGRRPLCPFCYAERRRPSVAANRMFAALCFAECGSEGLTDSFSALDSRVTDAHHGSKETGTAVYSVGVLHLRS